MLLIPSANSIGCPTTKDAAGKLLTDCPGYVGGPNSVFVSNISLTDNGKDYYGTYVNDDWKLTPKLTVNLGLRWDFFGLVGEHHENQANFVPTGPPTGGPMYIIPVGKNSTFLTNSVDR